MLHMHYYPSLSHVRHYFCSGICAWEDHIARDLYGSLLLYFFTNIFTRLEKGHPLVAGLFQSIS